MVGSRSDSLPLKPPPNQLHSPWNWRWNNRRPTLLRISSHPNKTSRTSRPGTTRSQTCAPSIFCSKTRESPSRPSAIPTPHERPSSLDSTSQHHLFSRAHYTFDPKTRRLVKRLACSSFSSAESASGISATASQTRLLTGPSRHQPSPHPPDETHSLPFAKQPP